MNTRSKNILFIGSDGCGKTTFLNKFSTTHNINLRTNIGHVTFNIIESNTINDDILRNRWDGVIVMFDLSNKYDCNEIGRFLHLLRNSNPLLRKIRIIVIGNKVDLEEAIQNIPMLSSIFCINEETYFSISTKTGYNINKPITHMVKELFGHDVIVI
jgi:GTPase SAR1 family protein